jgi:hypothetical protein
VLEAVGSDAGCGVQGELFAEGGGDSEHLDHCSSCQEASRAFLDVGRALDLVAEPVLSLDAAVALRERILRQVELEPSAFDVAASDIEQIGAALDRVAIPTPSAERFAQLRESILATTGAEPVRAGTVIRLQPPVWTSRILGAAAALLIGLGMGLTYQLLQSPPNGLPVESLASAVANDTSYQAEAMRSYRLASVSAPVRATRTTEDVLISFEDVIVEFPGTRASLMAIKSALPNANPRAGQIGYPYSVEVGQRGAKVLRYDYSNMNKLVNHHAFIDPRVRQSILLRQAMDAEELSVIARAGGDTQKADLLLANARGHYESVLRLDPDTKAAFLAREGLRRLA